MNGSGTVLFICPHHAARSVIAAAYFEREARRRGLPLVASSAGTDPAPAVLPMVVEALRAEGLDVSAVRPRGVTPAELAAARLVVTFDCDLPAPASTPEERWDGTPAPSEATADACAAIRRRVDDLVGRLAAGAWPDGRGVA